MRKILIFVFCFILVLNLSAIMSAQERKPNPAKRSKKLSAPTNQGSTGLFEIFTADNLRIGEFNFGGSFSHFDRDPGALGIDSTRASGAFGVHDRIEIFINPEVQRGIHAKNIRTYQPRPPLSPTRDPLGNIAYASIAPFIDVPWGSGFGDILAGAKFNFMSERNQNPFGLGARVFFKFPSVRNNRTALARGRGTGRNDVGFDFIVSKYAGPLGLNANTGFVFHQDPDFDGLITKLHNEWRYGVGVNFPTTSRIQGIIEVQQTRFIGNIGNVINDRVNPKDPVEIVVGGRFFPTKWFTFGGGYRYNAQTLKNNPALGILRTERHGYIVQLAFHRRKNEPPTATCTAEGPTEISKGGTVRLHVAADDPEDDPITINWKASGGTIDGTGETVTFTAPRKSGTYTVVSEVTDDSGAMGSCSIQVTVRNRPPTVRTEPESVTISKGDSTTIQAIASDPDQDPLTYEWSVNDQKVSGATGSEFTFDTRDRDAGSYRVSVTVSDGETTATASSTVTVISLPKVRCAAQPPEVRAGDRVRLAVSVDGGQSPYTYNWSVSPGGRIEGTGAEVSLDTTGLTAGTYTATATVTDANGKRDTCTASVRVTPRAPEKVVCDGLKPGLSRARNDCKAALDRVAEAMKSDPNITITITGYTDSREARSIGLRRAQSAATYLTKEQNVAMDRIKVVNGGSRNPVDSNKTAAGRAKNRRIEIEFASK